MNESFQTYAFANEHMIRASGLLSLLMPQPASGIGVGVKGLDGRYQMINQVMETLLGQSAVQIVGRTDPDLFPAEIAARLERADRRIVEGAAAASDELDLAIEGMHKRFLWLTFPVIGPEGRVLCLGVITADMSRKESVAEMRQTLEGLQQANRDLQNTLVELSRLACTDKLTGAWNRRRLADAVANEMERLRRYDHPLSLLIIDIDYFKRINDKHGHLAGDHVLAELALLIQSSFRATDSLTRWGGEEFAVLCPNTTLSTATMLADRLLKRVSETTLSSIGNITVSIGVAECMRGEIWDEWFGRADAALYRAKTNGRNQVCAAPEAPSRMGDGDDAARNFVRLVWHPAYECGHDLIDEQHRALFQHANELLVVLLAKRPPDEVAGLIDTLLANIVRHFNDEEAIFSSAGYPGAPEHAAIHRALVEKATALVGRFNSGTLAIDELFQFLAYDVVARHMLDADREFFHYLHPAP